MNGIGLFKWKDGRNAWESQEIKEYAEKACALGLM